MAIRRIGQILVDLGFISDEQLEALLEEQQQRPGELLGKLAGQMGLITEEQLAMALGEQMNLQVVNLADIAIAKDVLEIMTDTMAQMYRVIPILLDGESLTVATCDPQNLSIQDELRQFLGYDIQLVVAPEKDMQRYLEKYYSDELDSVESIIGILEEDDELRAAAEKLTTGRPIEL